MVRKILRVLVVLILLIAFGGLGVFFFARHPMPEGGASGPEADALAHQIEDSVNIAAWNQTGAVRFTFEGGGQKHRIGWDRRRNTAQVHWKNHVAHLDIGKHTGRAWTNGVEDSDPKTVESAFALFYNDTFWLNPLAKLFDPGVTRTKVTVDGKDALLVSYASGGVTPGDKYLWLLDDQHHPRAWRTWVSVLPVKGAEFAWEGWQKLPTGAEVSTQHRLLGILKGPNMRDVEAAESWDKLPQEQ
jgi:hypothetical protein